MTKQAKPATSKANSLTIEVKAGDKRSPETVMAEMAARGIVPAASLVSTYGRDTYSDAVSLTDTFKEVERLSASAASGDFAHIERLLAAQVFALNSMFVGLAHRSKSNSQEGYLGAAETYLRLSLRAQAQCRQTAQTLFELKNPRPVAFVQQANISNGPQQVNNGHPAATAKEVPAPARAEQSDTLPNRLLEANDGERMDTRAQGAAGRADQELAPMGGVDGTQEHGR
jgi:hypothetical protein